jgi:hypothetical protein
MSTKLIACSLLQGLWYALLLGASYFVLEARLGESFVYRIF